MKRTQIALDHETLELLSGIAESELAVKVSITALGNAVIKGAIERNSPQIIASWVLPPRPPLRESATTKER